MKQALPSRPRKIYALVLGPLAMLIVGLPIRLHAQSNSCSAPANAIVAENCLPGNSYTEWDINTKKDSTLAGDPSIQGFATDISVNRGSTISFKIKTNANAYAINIYRMGYYGGMGARKVASVTPSAQLPQTQPACLTDSSTGLYDCGNWAVSASWAVPATATSGIYFAHLVRTDTGGDSHIVFVVRDDSSHSDILFQTNDETWQAYNAYGGGSLYGPPGSMTDPSSASFDLTQRAYKVSYNRPFYTRAFGDESITYVFGTEYPMLEWLEQNGYSVTYFTGVDAARNGSLIKNHKVYLTSGHDEYWSGPHRANVQAARDAGVNMAFFTGNEVFWKTRWENSIDGTNTPYRTLVCYKETLAFSKIDPQDPPTWTGTWRDPSFSPPADGGNPENALTGTLFRVNGPGDDNPGTLSITVPSADGKMRFWRNTAIANLANGGSYTLPVGTLGYEWDEDGDNGSRPPGAFRLSTTTVNLTTDYLLDLGATYGVGTATHHLMMYQAPGGALVFGAGTVQWAWGLNDNHDDPFGETPLDPNMQQATVNLLADMGVQPATLQSGLLAATASTDKTAPSSQISSPAVGANIPVGVATSITGTATDSGGGVVGGVEVSLDGGHTWHPATGRGSWSYTWTPSAVGSTTILSRAVDDSGNLESPSGGVAVTVTEHDCPCESWPSSAVPGVADSGDGTAVELGVKFRTDYSGYITGIRFYKSAANTGTHIGSLWTSSGTLLASATFTNETSSGWQQVSFSTPVAINANTTYVASYFAPVGHYADDPSYFGTSGQDDPPVHLLGSGVDGANGLYSYSGAPVFPAQSYDSSNYWVDVVFVPNTSMGNGAPPALLVSNGSLSFAGYVGMANPPSQTVTVFNEGSGTLNWNASASTSWIVLSASSGTTPQSLSISANAVGLAVGTYTGTVTVSSPGANNGPQTISVSLNVTNVLLISNFASQGMQGWVPSPLGHVSDWSIANGALQYDGNGNSQLFAGNSAWTDYIVNATFKLSNLLNWPGGIRGRVNPSTGAGYMVWVYPALSQITLFRASAWDINQPLTQLGQASASFDTTNTHNLSLSFSGSQIQVVYDGKAIITASDSTYASGLVAVEGDTQVISFPQVLVTSGTPNSGSISLSSNSLNFSGAYGSANPAPQTVSISGGGGGTLTWTAASSAPWLTVSPGSGTTTASLQVNASLSSLTPGTYTATVTVTSLGAVNPSQQITANFTVTAPTASIVAAPASVSFVALTGQPAPSPQNVSISNGGYGSFSWTSSTDSAWLSATPASGSAPGTVSISVNATGLSAGSYSGHVVIAAQGVSNSPFSMPVTLQVLSQDMNENFSDMGNGWIISPMGQASGWSVSGSVYSFNGQGLSQSCTGNANWSDYTFDAKIKLASLSNWPGGIRGRVNPTTGAGYAVWLYPASGTVILYKVGQWNINGAVLTQLAQSNLSFDNANFHDFRMAFSGSTITVSWDGNALMSASDNSYPTGYVCLDAATQPIAYSTVQVAALQSRVALDSPSPSSLLFSAVPGSTPAPQAINITAGGAATAWAVTTSGGSWLTASQSSTLTPATLTVTANPSGLSEGTYNGTVTLYAPGASNSPITIPVTFGVKTALLSVTPGSLTFFGATTLNPKPQNLQVINAGMGNLGWTATVGSGWLSVTPGSGSAPGTINVQPNTTTMATGSYSDTVTISSPDVGNSPATVPISVQVGTLLFSDNFSSGSGNWTVGPLGNAGGWSAANGSYSYNGEGGTQSWAGSTQWTNYTAAVDFQLSNLSDYPGGLRGRLNSSTGASYGVWVYPAERVLKLYRIDQWNVNGSIALLGTSGTLNIDTNVHNLRLSFQDSTIQVYYDNSLVITATDSTYTQGAVALDVYNQPIAFTNVQVIGF